MPKKSCCCVSGTNCCDPIFFSDFITLAGETLDDAAPVATDDILVLVMNREGSSEGASVTVYGTCLNGGSPECRCTDCAWLKANWCYGAGEDEDGQPTGFCDCSDRNQNCEQTLRDICP
jgi:hypothetical protein